jgi:tetratricopeptide (TPR) repeat protein
MLLTAGPAWTAPKFDVSLDRGTISLGDSAVLSMTFEDCAPSGMPSLAPIANLQFGGQSEKESFSLIGASMTRKTIYSLELHPTKEGNFTIPSIEAMASGTRLKSRPITLKVLKGNAPPPAVDADVAFVRIVPATNIIYLGQVLPVELQCYCQDNVRNPQMPQFTSDNFIIGELPNTHQQAPHVRMGNTDYNLFTFRFPATAIKTGKFNLGPATWSLTVLGQRNFFGWDSHPATFNSDAPEIRVLPMPSRGAPPSFNGAIGDFNLSQYDAGPTTVGVSDPITLKIRVAGRGAFGTVTLPTNNEGDWREFKTYPPTAKVETSDPMQMEGSKYFEQVITPQNTEVKEIPPFVFSFFDPAQNGFRTLTHPAIPLIVHATAATPQPTVLSAGAAPPETPEQGEDIVHIKPMLGKLRAVGPPLLQQPGFLAWQVLAPLAWICALTRRVRKEKLANNPRLRRQRQVAELMRKGLADLARLAAANDAEKFYATVLRLLQEQLGERLDLPAPAITEAVLDGLPQNGLRPETPALLRELFQACNQYRYTPEHTSREMTSLIPKVKTALQDLQAMPATPIKSNLPQGVGLLLLLLGAMSLRAEPAREDFNQANKFYEEGKYTQAAAAYEKITQAGSVSPALYFNLGNARLKAGQIGRAICSYRQAEAMAPRDPDIRANLQIARTQAGVNNAALPGNRATRWIGHLTLNEWTVAASAAVVLFFLVLTARELWPALKKSGAAVIVLLGFACLGLVVCLGLAVEQRLLEKSSVVIVPEAVARRGPLPESQSVFTVHDGAELLVLGSDGDWLQVSDAAHHIGWLAQKEVAFIP